MMIVFVLELQAREDARVEMLPITVPQTDTAPAQGNILGSHQPYLGASLPLARSYGRATEGAPAPDNDEGIALSIRDPACRRRQYSSSEKQTFEDCWKGTRQHNNIQHICQSGRLEVPGGRHGVETR